MNPTTDDATFIVRADLKGTGPSVAVKDLIDLVGFPTTAGSPAVAATAPLAERDAVCLAGARSADARIVGKTNLVELAFGTSGINQWYGTPRNPLDPTRVPGGSSSGSAVAVATGEALVAYGTDTGGSIRVPAAFCGAAGLKTTHGRIALDGVRPLAPTLDTVGPMARDVAGLVLGMRLLEPGFMFDAQPAGLVGRVRLDGVHCDPKIDAAVDGALAAAELAITEVALPRWEDARNAGVDLLLAEAAISNGSLLENPESRARLSPAIADRLVEATQVSGARVSKAQAFQQGWIAVLATMFERVELLALPTVGFPPPRLEDAANASYNECTMPINLAGYPAVALPVRSAHALPASLQLVGPPHSEALLLATAELIETAAGCPLGQRVP